MPPLLKGAIIGFSIAAPVGPIGLLCIQRSLTQGRAAGLACGLGAASADAAYGSIAAFGLAAISSAILRFQTPLQLVGGFFLLYLGLKTLRSTAASQAAKLEANSGLARLFGSTFLLTAANPMTILSFAAIFAGLGLGAESHDFSSAVLLVTGVFAGSAAWWLILSTVAAAIGTKMSGPRLKLVNVISGGIIVGFAVWQLAQFASKLRT